MAQMSRIVSRHRFATGVSAFLVLIAASAILLQPRIARAFTLVTSTIYFDPVSVPVGHTLQLHVVNQLGAGPIGIFPTLKPTSPALGSTVTGAAAAIPPGDGNDQSFPFAGFSPTPATTRIPVVCSIAVVGTGGSTLPFDFSGRIASSIEITDDATGKPTAILAARHIVITSSPCLFCN
jgi:hypothetical protein